MKTILERDIKVNKIELQIVLEKAMDLVVDGQNERALSALWTVHRALRGISYTVDVPGDQPRIYADEVRTALNDGLTVSEARAWAEARASVALDGDTYSLDDRQALIRAKDRARKQADRDRAKAGDLPPMKTINGKPPRPKTKSIDVACPTCTATRGEPCFKMDHAGRGGKPILTETVQTYHRARTEKAARRG